MAFLICPKGAAIEAPCDLICVNPAAEEPAGTTAAKALPNLSSSDNKSFIHACVVAPNNTGSLSEKASVPKYTLVASTAT